MIRAQSRARTVTLVPEVASHPVVLRWPDEDGLRATLRAQGRPRLLIVTDGQAAPLDLDPLEDWVTSSARAQEIEARASALALRTNGAGAGHPVVDDDDLLRYRGRWVALGAIEARMARLFVERIGTVVRRAELERAAWGRAANRSNTTDAMVHRFRTHAASVGLDLVTVRARGYVLQEPAPHL
jgi:DNA-binding response OmpR family regulator